MESGFYTMKGYQIMEPAEMSSAMEDYLEMISRLLRVKPAVRVGELSEMLNVKPSSVSKMVRQLSAAGLINAQRYGIIYLSEKGRAEGEYLLYRHETVHAFLKAVNGTLNELEQTEKIEHFLNRRTVENIEKLTSRMKECGKP